MQPDGVGFLGESSNVIVNAGAFLTRIRCRLTATYGLQRYGRSNGRGEYTNSMNGWRTSSVVSTEERCRSGNDYHGCFEELAGTCRQKRVALQDASWKGCQFKGHPMSHEELAAEILEAGTDVTARTTHVKRTKPSSSLKDIGVVTNSRCQCEGQGSSIKHFESRSPY
ncbi:hypothetical protein ARMGADRAFT_220351 [Armillaria gallica]|uniref:Uncharacterized protein n=1 Tax=Armillaria gallica TaxID=47427 RepID=A0A2H3E5X4_ARMGA|nr:hypothetical protein ARMGADRAFT_220351 [Armillaria gallica]